MKVKVLVVDIEVSPRVKRWALRVAMPAVVLTFAGMALATPLKTYWAPSSKLTSQELSDNFKWTEERLHALESAKPVFTAGNGKKYSLSAVVCGVTSTTYDGAGVQGYDGAKGKCEIACNSASAHMCTAEELLRSQATDPSSTIAVQNAWYSVGAYASYVPQGTSTPATRVNDCQGWRQSNGPTDLGPMWASGVNPNNAACSDKRRIACCD